MNSMKDGEYVIYIVQSKVVLQSPHGNPNGPLEPVPEDEWHWCASMGSDLYCSPWHNTSKGYIPKYPKSCDERHEVWSLTGHHGWFDIKYALLAVERAKILDDEGKLNSKDGYGKITSNYRHEFRIIKRTMSQTTEVVPVDAVEFIFGLGILEPEPESGSKEIKTSKPVMEPFKA